MVWSGDGGDRRRDGCVRDACGLASTAKPLPTHCTRKSTLYAKPSISINDIDFFEVKCTQGVDDVSFRRSPLNSLLREVDIVRTGDDVLVDYRSLNVCGR